MSRSAAPALLLAALSCAHAAPAPPGEGLPGAAPFPPELTRLLAARARELGESYKPRTRHLEPDGSARYTNRLLLSSSPYLLQHAHNPVNWYPWGDEAFATAKRLGRPVLLSIGYSTCHWCHVMEEESFEDEDIARVMNEQYVAIKVDREERPDVDAIYMTAVQALTGGGGWPMTVWLTSDRQPFHGGTYVPARDGDRGVRHGFLTLLQRLREIHDREPARVRESAAELTRELQRRLVPPPGGAPPPGAAVLRAAGATVQGRFDAVNGGARGAPKFPSSLPVRFLLRHHLRFDDAESLRMAALTLEKMAAAGMYDQVAGGFHRYATDERWLVPHFEKMLYDNALLAVAYLEGYQATGREEFAAVARDILRYVERDMTSPQGGFYSATDADSLTPGGQREEGYLFTWTPAELEAALGDEQARILAAYYGVTPQGNFEGRNILHVPAPLGAVAERLGLAPRRLASTLETGRETLYRARARRPAPLRDEKILTSWNGLMIGAFAQAALLLGEPGHARTATRAADFVLTHLRRDGRLLRSFAAGRAHQDGFLDDYAFLVAGLLDLFEATGEARWIEEAVALDAVLAARFEDREAGGFFMTGDDHERLLARDKPGYDGAEPSGNSVAILNLLRLHELTTDDRYRQRADRALGAFRGILDRAPDALSEMLLALDFRTYSPREIVIVTAGPVSQAEPLIATLRGLFLPNRVLALVAEGAHLAAVAKRVPLVRDKVARGGKPTAYVCEGGVCALPTTDPEVFARQLRTLEAPRPAPPTVTSPGTSP